MAVQFLLSERASLEVATLHAIKSLQLVSILKFAPLGVKINSNASSLICYTPLITTTNLQLLN